MIIGIDANEANLTPNRVGVNQYAFYLLQAFRKLETEHKFVIYLKSPPLPDLPSESPNFNYRTIPFPKFWTQTRLPLDLYTHSPRPDIFFSMTHYAPRWSPIPVVIAIMDLGFITSPEQFTIKDINQLKNWTAYSIKKAEKIIAISNYTKQDISKYFKRSPQDITVTYLGYDKELFKLDQDQTFTEKVLRKYGIIKPYFLFLGSLKPSKNISNLIISFDKFRKVSSTFSRFKLVISGKNAWLYQDIYDLVAKLKLSREVIFTDFVPEPELPSLLSGASAFVLPSFHEGFGIPVLEAMASGVPVVVSKAGSLPEVAETAGIYIDPYSQNSIVEGLKTSQVSPGKFVKAGLSRVKSFSWDKTARQTLLAIENTARKN